ncbi:hypothetical protein PMAYCL1PPCAC_26584, partial [Pristionchus mayeri]
LNAPIYFENKDRLGKVDEIFGGPKNNGFSVKLSDGIKASSFNNQKVCIDPAKLLPVECFLPQAPSSRGRGRGGGRGGRGGRGGGGFGGIHVYHEGMSLNTKYTGCGGGDRGGRLGFRGGDRGGFRGGDRGHFKRSFDGGNGGSGK